MFKYQVKKGDTLNSISKRFGFRNFRDAGIKRESLQSYRNKATLKDGQDYADLIYPNEQITLENYDPNKVQTSAGATPTVINAGAKRQAFNDKQKTFEEDQRQLEEKKLAQTNTDTNQETPTDTPKTEIPKTGNDIYDAFKESTKELDTKYDNYELEQNAKYEARYQTDLANLDAGLASDIEETNRMYAERIKNRRRLDTLNTSRVKAYGLGGGGIYQPVMFGQAITLREQEMADNIARLEDQRKGLVTKLKNAYESGKAGLANRLDDQYQSVKKEIYDNIRKEKENAYKMYQLDNKVLKEKEEKDKLRRQEAVKNIQALVSLNKEKYENMTPEELNNEAIRLAMEEDIELIDAQVAINAGKKVDLKDTLTQANIDYKNAQTRGVEAKTANTISGGSDSNDEDFFSNSQLRELNRAGLENAPQQQKIDFIDMDRDSYETKYPNGNENVTEDADIENLRESVEKGKILVKDKDGNIGKIPEEEFDENIYTKI